MGNGILNSSVMIRREVVEKVGSFDLSIPGNSVQDYDLWLRVASHFPVDFVFEPVTVIRFHGEQGIWNRQKMLTDELKVLERRLDISKLVSNWQLRKRMLTFLMN